MGLMVSTLSESLSWGQGVLMAAGVDSPRLDAELLLAHTLGWRRAQLYTHPEQSLEPETESQYKLLIARRARREPLAYLLAHREFYGLDFIVDRRVLIPRPETELLVSEAIVRARRALQRTATVTIADIGTGSGAVAVALAHELPMCQVCAVDVSRPALKVVEQNCRRHGVEDRVRRLCGDLLIPLSHRVDIIVANLPYIAPEEVPALPAEVCEYEPQLAWNGGSRGVATIARMLDQAPKYLVEGGSALLEVGATQAAVVQELARRRFPAATVRTMKDAAGLDRVVAIDTALPRETLAQHDVHS